MTSDERPADAQDEPDFSEQGVDPEDLDTDAVDPEHDDTTDADGPRPAQAGKE